MVIAYGNAELESEDVWDVTRDLVAKYHPDDPDQIDRFMGIIFEDQTRVLITVKPDDLITRSPDE